jgi:hypothetical protein
LKDNELVFSWNEEDELEELLNKLYVFATQGTLIYPNCRKVANCLMLDSSTSDYIKTKPLIKSLGSIASMR